MTMRAVRMRLAGAGMVLAFTGVVLLAFAQFQGDFTPVERVTVSAPRAGLVLDPDAKVKLRGVEIGRVERIDRTGSRAELTLALNPQQLRLLPADVLVNIRSTTVFGAKYVNFVLPEHPSPRRLTAGARLSADAVTVEFDTLFQHLSDLLSKIEPQKLNATLSAIAVAVHGRGVQIGELIDLTDRYLATMNPKLPALQRDFAKAADVAGNYADAAPDLLRTLAATSTTADTVVAEQQNLDAVLLGVTGLANTAGGVLNENRRNLGTALDELADTSNLLRIYAPVLNCVIVGLDKVRPLDEKIFGGGQEGVALNSGFMYGAQPYRTPQDLPKVHATGGPNCRGLPNPPRGPNAPHAPYVVTDTATVPYAPSTRLDVDGPRLFQLLYGGMYPGVGLK